MHKFSIIIIPIVVDYMLIQILPDRPKLCKGSGCTFKSYLKHVDLAGLVHPTVVLLGPNCSKAPQLEKLLPTSQQLQVVSIPAVAKADHQLQPQRVSRFSQLCRHPERVRRDWMWILWFAFFATASNCTILQDFHKHHKLISSNECTVHCCSVSRCRSKVFAYNADEWGRNLWSNVPWIDDQRRLARGWPTWQSGFQSGWQWLRLEARLATLKKCFRNPRETEGWTETFQKVGALNTCRWNLLYFVINSTDGWSHLVELLILRMGGWMARTQLIHYFSAETQRLISGNLHISAWDQQWIPLPVQRIYTLCILSIPFRDPKFWQ